jgi:ATP-binding cassette subfamily A (ABC1) protein 3
LSTIPFTYILTFLFSDPGNGQVIIFFINLVFGICPIIFLILRIFAVDQVKNIIIFITYFIRIFPPFTFGYGIINITNRQIWALLNKTNI